MTPARCATCDRAEEIGGCEVAASFASKRLDDRSGWNLRARKDCEAHAVDWRARAIAAETERTRQVADLLALIEHRIAETFAAGATMRLCRHCGDVTVGGPTACSGCVRAESIAAQRDAAIREADRWRHGVPVEGDFVCPDSLALHEARAECDRLRAERDQLAADTREAFARVRIERDRLAAEVERLRATLGHVATVGKQGRGLWLSELHDIDDILAAGEPGAGEG